MGRKAIEKTESTEELGERRKNQLTKLEALKKSEPDLAAVVEKRLTNLWAMLDAANAESATLNKILGLGK